MGMVKRVYGRDGQPSTCYLTRIKLTPKTRWGRLCFHFFHRGDHDRDPHDHPYDFWTFPLRTYYEDVLDPTTGRTTRNVVQAFRVHFRPAEYTHIQLGAARYMWEWTAPVKPGEFPTRAVRKNVFGGWTATFVWHKPVYRVWGFWMLVGHIYGVGRYHWLPWRDYLSS